MSKQKQFLLSFLLVTFMGVAIILVSPVFRIREVIVTGYSNVGRMEINARLGIGTNSNLLLFSTNAARRRLMQNLNIEEVIIVRDFPGRLYVTIRERRLAGYIENMQDQFLFIDESGRVIEIRNERSDNLPVVKGLRFTGFVLGEHLDVPDQRAFSTIVRYAQMLSMYGLTHRVTYIDVSDVFNIRILIGSLEINVGDISYAEEKVRTIQAILQEMPGGEPMPGFIDLREIRRDNVFIILT